REDAFAKRENGALVVAGKPDSSRIWARISSQNPALRMPPPGSGKTLTTKQKDLVRRWIAQGANWTQHWAFIAPKRPHIPALPIRNPQSAIRNPKSTIRNTRWPRNPIDQFILARLD